MKTLVSDQKPRLIMLVAGCRASGGNEESIWVGEILEGGVCLKIVDINWNGPVGGRAQDGQDGPGGERQCHVGLKMNPRPFVRHLSLFA